MFFLIPKNVTSERPSALVPTLIRWWETLSAQEVAQWQQKYRIDWECYGWTKYGGAQRAVWEMLMEFERFKYQAGEEDLGAVALVLDVAKQSSCGVGLGDALQFLKEDIAGAMRVLRAPVARAVRRKCGRAAHDHHGFLATVPVELLVSACCFAGCTGMLFSVLFEVKKQGVGRDGDESDEKVKSGR